MARFDNIRSVPTSRSKDSKQNMLTCLYHVVAQNAFILYAIYTVIICNYLEALTNDFEQITTFVTDVPHPATGTGTAKIGGRWKSLDGCVGTLQFIFIFSVRGVHPWPVVCSNTIGLVPKSSETETSRLDLQQLSKLSQVSLEAKT